MTPTPSSSTARWKRGKPPREIPADTSGKLADVYRKNPKYGFSDSDRPEEIIRRVMNTVGKPYLPGQNVRCVISVNMLTEGWNTRTVTHLLGFRRFGRQPAMRAGRGQDPEEGHKDQRKTTKSGSYRSTPRYWASPSPSTKSQRKKRKSSDGKRFRPVTVEPQPDRRHLRVEWPNVVQLQRTGGNRPIEVRAKPEGPDETHEVPDHVQERTNVEPTAGQSIRVGGEPPVTAQRFIYLAAGAVAKRIEMETEQQSKEEDGNAPRHPAGKAFQSDRGAPGQEYRQAGRLTGPEDQDRWPSDETAVLRASEWLHRNIQIIKPDNAGVADGSHTLVNIPPGNTPGNSGSTTLETTQPGSTVPP